MRNYALTLALMLLCCNLSAQSVQREADSHAIAKVDRAAERMKHHILNSATDLKPMGAVYYVSAEGDDANDGLSPQTPLRTLAKVNELELKPSDQVSGKEAQSFSGLHSRTSKDDPFDFAVFQGSDSQGYSYVSLSCAGRSDCEDEVVFKI